MKKYDFDDYLGVACIIIGVSMSLVALGLVVLAFLMI